MIPYFMMWSSYSFCSHCLNERPIAAEITYRAFTTVEFKYIELKNAISLISVSSIDCRLTSELVYIPMHPKHLSRQTCAVDICHNQMTFIQNSAVKVSLLELLMHCHELGLTVAYCPEHRGSLFLAPHVACQCLKLMGSCSLIRDVNNRNV